jgi:hypothetical protein
MIFHFFKEEELVDTTVRRGVISFASRRPSGGDRRRRK